MLGVERTRGRPARGDAPGETPPGSDLGPRKTVRLQKYAYEKAKNDANSYNGVNLALRPISIRAIRASDMSTYREMAEHGRAISPRVWRPAQPGMR